jgi:hypothetical protein
MNAQAKSSTHAGTTSTSSNHELLTGRHPVPVADITVKTKFEPDPTHGQRELGSDAFSYYSNKLNLMKTLLMKDDDDIQVLPIAGITSQGPLATKRRKGSNAQPVPIQDGGVRQKRLSFEAHPSLIIYDDIIRMLEQMDCAKISDDAEEEEEEELNDEVSDDDEDEEKIKSSVLCRP